MESKGKIGLIMPHIDSFWDSDLISGIFETAFQFGYDVIVMTGVLHPIYDYDYKDYTKCLENIYTLAGIGSFDGIIFSAGWFNDAEVRNRIFDILKDIKIPVVVLEHENDEFPCIFTPQRDLIKEVTNHLIYSHNCKKLYCITGMRDNFASMERLMGFTEAMNEAGLFFDDSHIFYGNFWKEIPSQTGIDIAKGRIPKPDGIVCANDAMAIALYESLTKHGIKVPEDIAVTGYDGSWDAFTNELPITTVSGHERQTGRLAIKRLLSALGHSVITDSEDTQYLCCGASCGCIAENAMFLSPGYKRFRKYSAKMNDIYTTRRCHITSDLIGRMSACNTLESLVGEAGKLKYMLSNWNWLDICLCEDWMYDFNNPTKYRSEGYSEKMLIALSMRGDNSEEAMYTFPSNEILPALSRPHEPRIFIITSLHSNQQIFGYICTSCQSAYDFLIDDYYINWCDALSNGLQVVQSKLRRNYIKQQFENLSDIDPATGLYNKKGLVKHITELFNRYEKCGVIMLSKKQGADSELSSLLAISNVLRLSESNDSLLASPAEDVIAYATVLNSENTAMIDRFFVDLGIKLIGVYGGEFCIDWSKIVSDSIILNSVGTSEIEMAVTKLLNAVLQKAADASSNIVDYHKQLLDLRHEMLANPQLKWNIDDIAKDIGISKSHFQRLYKEMFHSSCIDDIINARIERAKWMLINTDIKIGEIAHNCGYANQSHFIRQFRSIVGITATSYRNKSE